MSGFRGNGLGFPPRASLASLETIQRPIDKWWIGKRGISRNEMMREIKRYVHPCHDMSR